MQGFDEVAVASIMKATLEGLNYMHIHGRIHRDIKVILRQLDASVSSQPWLAYLRLFSHITPSLHGILED